VLSFIIRRLGASILVLLVASFLIYNLASLAGDPLGDLRGSTAPNKAALIAARIDQLQLNVPTPLRFFIWLSGLLKVFIGQFTLGDSVNGHSVLSLLGSSAANTLQLVTAATLLAVIFGVAIGMSTAIRQYSGYDYSVTFLSFLFFSLPAFWVAVLLKLYVAIGFNNFLGSPVISPLSITVISLVSGFIWMSIIGGEGKPRLIVFGSATVISAATLGFLVVTDWFMTPQLGPVLIAVLGALTALMVTSLTTGLSNRRALYAALITVAIGVALWYPLQFLFAAFPAFWLLGLLGVLSIAVGLAVGYFVGKDDRWPAARTAAITSFLVGLLVLADRLMRSWPDYLSAVGGRPIATVGANTPDLQGSIWLHVIDSYTHLLLPTMSLILISLAGYTRYARASLLEVMNQDYVRTARAKGLTERTVVMRHAFRNAMIPIITVVAFDSEAMVLVRPQRAGNRNRISQEIGRLNSGGGTNIYPGLKEAFEILQGINAKVKHVILMTDGEAPTDGLADLVNEMRQARITVSCVGVQGADRNMLAMIADAGEGRLYMVEDIGSLPRIFMKETQEAQKSQLVEDLIHVRVAKKVEAIEGTNVEAAPALHGYVTTKPKPTSETILISDLGEPILARWRYGAGTSVAWTSDVKNRWSVDWLRWAGYPKFWAQVVRSSMRRKVYDSYDLTAKVADGRAQVTVDAIDTGDKFVNELETSLEVIDPATNKTVETVAMAQTAAGRYTADFKIQKYGSYMLKAVHKRNGQIVAESLGAVALSYPLEYLRTTPNLESMKHAAAVSGGHDNATPTQMWDPEHEEVSYTQDLWPWILLGVVLLFVLDLYAKRVRLFGYRTIKF